MGYFIQPDSLYVYSFVNVGRESLGIIILPVIVEPATLPIPIHVWPDTLNYNLLLGRPYIHAIKEVPHTLQHTIKFIHDNELHTIKADTNPYSVQDEVGCIYFFNIMIPPTT